jgi:hypothetical protein
VSKTSLCNCGEWLWSDEEVCPRCDEPNWDFAPRDIIEQVGLSSSNGPDVKIKPKDKETRE